MDSSWNPILNKLYQEPLLELRDKILPNISYYPESKDIFNAFKMDMNKVKVVILGQDPYPTPSTAIGYAFAVNKDRVVPPSLRIIHNEIVQEKNLLLNNEIFLTPAWKTLNHWVEQGVLLLNTALTVEAGKAGSHLTYWEEFIKSVIRYLSNSNPCIWLLWGKKAQAFKTSIYNPYKVSGYNRENISDIPVVNYNYILEACHPAASLYGGNASFIGCDHFYLANEILKETKKKPIKW